MVREQSEQFGLWAKKMLATVNNNAFVKTNTTKQD